MALIKMSKSTNLKRYTYSCIHTSTIYDNQDMEEAQEL